jgi:O-antigen/teichoic acid export membrane protein
MERGQEISRQVAEQVGMTLSNALANFAGQLIAPILSIALVPFYIGQLGLEGYGLVGFFSMLVALLGVLESGLGAALVREFARRSESEVHRRSLWGLLRTFELFYWAIGLIMAIILIGASSLVSTSWVRVESITGTTLRLCLLLISARIAFTFPMGVYRAAFVGTQRQVRENALGATVAVITAASGVAVVLITRSVIGLYANELVNATWGLVLFRSRAFRVLEPWGKTVAGTAFQWTELRNLWRISVQLIWTQGIGLVVTQFDRFVISRLFPIASLGVYTAGIAGGRLVSMFYGPFIKAVIPQTMQLAQDSSGKGLHAHLLRNAKVVMILGMAIGMPAVFFSRDILQAWTGNAAVVKDGTAVMSIYVIGSILISYTDVLYQAQIALGKMRYNVLFNTLALGWFLPAVWVLVDHFGLVGAACAWTLYAAVAYPFHVVVTTRLIHVRGGLLAFVRVGLLTTVVGVLVLALARGLAAAWFPDSTWARLLVAAAGSGTCFATCYLVSFGTRIPAEVRALLPQRG